jgi:polar amino acid transport system substrate-binding protein
MKVLFTNKFILTVFLCWTQVAIATDKIIVVTENWFPYNYVSSEGKLQGPSTNAVQEILDLSGIGYSIKMYPWLRAYNMTEKFPNTLIYSIYRTPEREHLFQWICPIAKKVKQNIYRLSSRTDIKIKNEHDFSKYTFSVIRGTFPQKLLESKGLKEGINLQVVSENVAHTQMLLKNRVDLTVEVEAAMFKVLEDNDFAHSYVTKEYELGDDDVNDLCMAFNKQTPIALVNKVRVAHQKFLSKKEAK